MIKSWRHKGIKKFFMKNDASGIPIDHAEKIRTILTYLEGAKGPEDMDLSRLDLHRLTGRRKGFWTVKVSGPWRITFCFDGGHARLVDYENYH